MRIFDHVDLRVADLKKAGPFYRAILPVLGFSIRVDLEGWLQFEAPGDGPCEFFGIIEDPSHRPNANRIAFWAESIAKVDEISGILTGIGALNVEGPGFESDYYYAVYFNDPCGNPLEVCHRLRRFIPADEQRQQVIEGGAVYL
jgi:catechol 2,3-dioxygenase-like lactoylglutathione lyase family enzyme